MTQPIVLDPTSADPHSEHHQLRAQGPAAQVSMLGVRAWGVTCPALLKELLCSANVSKDPRQHWPSYEEARKSWPLAPWVVVENMITAYGSDHQRLRRLISPALSARRMTAHTVRIESLVQHLLDDLVGTAPGEVVDLRERFAYPLPIQALSHLMGLPEQQIPLIRKCVNAVFSTTLSSKATAEHAATLYSLLDSLIVDKRRCPGDDMTSVLISARDQEGDGSALSDTELRDTLLLMISAGYETTANAIDQAITTLLSHPTQLAHVLTGRAAWEAVVEETLRLEPAAKHLPMRFAVEDIPLPDGQVIARGDAILASYAAANRDPAWHERADEFDVTRTKAEHLAFGHGPHYCLGAPFARLQISTALRCFFDRFPQAELAVPADQLQPLGSLISNGHETVPVRLRPAESDAL